PGMAAQVQIYDTLEDAMGAARGDSHSDVINPCPYRVYKRRCWYILAVYCLLAFNQGVIWNTWGPLKDAMQSAYSWGNFEFGMLPNWAPIGFVIALAPSLIIVNRCGLKVACLSGASLMAVGTVAPCFLAQSASFTEAFTIVCHIDALFCGLSCPVAMALPPALSAVWFPPGERILSTSVATLSNYVGSAFSFQFGHLFVKNSTNTTVEDIRQSVAHLLYLECGLAFFSLLLFVAYFPAKPKLPSSASAQVNRLSFRDSLAQLIGRGDNGGTCFALWSACLAYSIVAGVNGGGFLAAFNLNVETLGASVAQADAAGFWSVLSAGLVCLPVALLSGPVEESIEAFLTCLGILPTWPSLIFATSCAGCVFLYSAVPFFFELAADLAYPAPESVICGFLTLGNNLVAMAFLGVVTGGVGVDKAGRMLWINWTMAAVCFAALLALVVAPARLRRNLADVAAESGDLLGEGDGSARARARARRSFSNDRDSLLPKWLLAPLGAGWRLWCWRLCAGASVAGALVLAPLVLAPLVLAPLVLAPLVLAPLVLAPLVLAVLAPLVLKLSSIIEFVHLITFQRI
uniref:MFS domain-containing protein n=1 Tax=Macrostomum lignano TaxID=282301 RepID=A0A1I8F2A6_9PLAT